MLKRLFRWQYWRWRASYWRKRTILAEKRLAAEMWRDRERSDTFATVQMRALGLFGMPARDGPAPPRRVNPTQALTAATDPWEGLSYADRQEYDLFWKTDAEAAGIPQQQAKQEFLKEIAKRRQPLNDDGFAS